MEKKASASKKETVMIIMVVVLAFGLTVIGIVYLTGFLLGEDKVAVVKIDNETLPDNPIDNSTTVIFVMDNATTVVSADNTTASVVVPTVPATATPSVPKAATTSTPPAVASVPYPAAVPSTPAVKKKFAVQLLALQSETKANAEAQRFQKDCPDIYVEKADLGAKGVWFRVRCFSTDSRADADVKKTEMERKYNLTPYVVQ